MGLIDGGTLTSVPGVLVGHWTALVARTGCTVVVLPEPNVITAEVRGAAPATREYALLQAGMTVQQAQAVLLTGGSAFGLAAADGVMRALEADGRGHPTPVGPVPIVPAASVFDLGVGDAAVRPGPDEGAEAFRAAGAEPVAGGQVGAGTGATVSNWRNAPQAGGLGSAATTVGSATVAALAVVNAVGDVFSLEGEPLTGGPHVAGRFVPPESAGANTTLVVVATDARLDRPALHRLCVRSHDALGACLRPGHTAFDGDVCFAVSVGDVDEPPHDLAEGAFEATARAVEDAIRASRS